MTPHTTNLETMLAGLESTISTLKDTGVDGFTQFLSTSNEVAAYKEATIIDRLIETSGDKHKEFIQYFQQTAVNSDAMRVYAALGGNRSGKTTTCMTCFAWYIREHARDGEVFYVISPTEEKSKSGTGVQWEISRLFPAAWYGEEYRPKSGYTNNILILSPPDGRKIQIKFKFASQSLISFETDKITGILQDEAADEELYDTLLPRLLDKKGFFLIATLPKYYWLKSRVVLSEDKYVYARTFLTRDNPHLSGVAIDQMAANMSAHERRVRIEAEFAYEMGLVFPEFNTEVHVCKPFTIPALWPRYVCMDLGYIHPCATLWFAISPEDTVYIYREIYESGLNSEKVAQRIKNLCGTGKDAEHILGYYLDPQNNQRTMANNITMVDQMRGHGLPFTMWRRTTDIGGKPVIVDKVRLRLENRSLMVFSSCPQTAKEFQVWSYKRNTSGQVLTGDEKYEDKNNHALDTIMGFLTLNKTFAAQTATVSVPNYGTNYSRKSL
jgi:hypothetical protein